MQSGSNGFKLDLKQAKLDPNPNQMDSESILGERETTQPALDKLLSLKTWISKISRMLKIFTFVKILSVNGRSFGPRTVLRTA